MSSRLVLAAASSLALAAAHAQPADRNLQDLLAGLTSGAEVLLVTPLASGMLQVTSFRPAGRMDAGDAVAAVERARQALALLGTAQPTGEQLAGMLVASGHSGSIRSQVVPPGTVVPGAEPSAAAGGTVQPTAREQALRELARIGILNPSDDQIRTAVLGGTVTTVNGPVTLPGILTR